MAISRTVMTGRLFALILVPLVLAAAMPAQAAQNCISTYDKRGNVTGRYCSDGPAEPPGETVEESVPSAPPAGRSKGRRAAAPLPDGMDIQCNASKGKRCRGVFFIR